MNNVLHSFAATLFLATELGILTSSADGAPEPHFPATLVRTAEAFKSAAPTNRYAEAEQLSRELPKCPVTSQKDVGTGIYRSYDFSKPSYVLTSKDVLELLGNPITVKTNDVSVRFLYLIRTRQG